MTIGSQLDFHDSRVLFILLRLQIVFVAHLVEVHVLSINHSLLVRRDRTPHQALWFFFLILQVSELASRVIVREVEHFLLSLALTFLFILLRLGIASRNHFESECTTIFLSLQVLDRQLMSFERVLYDFSQLRSHLFTVEKKSLGAGCRVHHIPESTIACLVLIPEVISLLEPMRIYCSREQHGVQLLLCKFLCLQVFRQSFLRLQCSSSHQTNYRQGHH